MSFEPFFYGFSRFFPKRVSDRVSKRVSKLGVEIAVDISNIYCGDCWIQTCIKIVRGLRSSVAHILCTFFVRAF